MPTIRPIDVADCRAFIEQHGQEIRCGVYDVEIPGSWVKSLDETILLFLARHCTASMLTLAKSEDAPASVLELLADSPYDEVRSAVARNPHLPERALNQLAMDRVTDVIKGVLDNPVHLSQDTGKHRQTISPIEPREGRLERGLSD